MQHNISLMEYKKIDDTTFGVVESKTIPKSIEDINYGIQFHTEIINKLQAELAEAKKLGIISRAEKAAIVEAEIQAEEANEVIN